ncbi:MAG: hypothetical protein F4X95_03910 [Oligoflexia bacterium]|nr:hypothetical protein [Bdellovibrionales bacterium]MYE07877.1 hypothetical protein [Oligoflexia bacterium]
MKDKKKTVLLEPSGEEKAFVYQQALELSPLLDKSAPIAVILEKNEFQNRSKYSVTFILIPDKLNIKITSEGDNLFDVCITAKNKAKKTISYLINQMDSPARTIKMEHFKKFPYPQ